MLNTVCLEIIRRPSGDIFTETFSKETFSKETFSKKTFSKKTLKNSVDILEKIKANILLDYHGVYDTLSKETITDISRSVECVVISYVGRQHYEQTSKILTEEVTLGNIKAAVLVFERGTKNKKNSFTIPGSKAWVCDNLNLDKKSFFVDDSEDHIKSTQSLKIKGLSCVLVNKSAEESVKCCVGSLVSDQLIKKVIDSGDFWEFFSVQL